MRLLIIGGTRFVGWHFAQAALARGHELTVFSRGLSGPAPDGVRHLMGDRDASLVALAEGRWDAVIDTCAFRPAQVRRMADALSASVERYLLVSTVSVYASSVDPNDENSALGWIADDDPAHQSSTVEPRSYGPLKASCERTLLGSFGPERSLIVRPGLIVGPRDTTQRFPYWPARMARAVAGEPVLLPGTPQDRVQFIDARDLADFMLGALEQSVAGCFNTVSPPGQWTMGDVADACSRVAGTSPQPVWVSAADLERLGLRPWTDLPLWVPAEGEHRSFGLTDVSRASAAGLRTRSLEQTVADTLHWWHGLPADKQVFATAGLSPEREAQALRELTA